MVLEMDGLQSIPISARTVPFWIDDVGARVDAVWDVITQHGGLKGDTIRLDPSGDTAVLQ